MNQPPAAAPAAVDGLYRWGFRIAIALNLALARGARRAAGVDR